MKKQIKKVALIERIKLWLFVNENSTAKLAAALGYKSSNTITMWLRRGAVPACQRARVLAFIRKETR